LESAATDTIGASGTNTPHKQAGYMTAPTSRQKMLQKAL